MNKQEIELLFFYCEKLGINSPGKLYYFKKYSKAKDNKELLEKLRIAYCGR